MDPFAATWSSQMEMDDLGLLQNCQTKSSIDQPNNYISFSDPEIRSSGPPSTLTFCKIPSSSSPISSELISFSSSNSTKPSSCHHHETLNFTVENEAGMDILMMYLGSTDFSSTYSPSCQQEVCNQNGSTGYDQSSKRGGSGLRTLLQAKYHVIAERKRRAKLLQQFIALSAVVPGLKKLNKTSIMDGGIEHLKQHETRLKILEEGAKVKPEESDPEEHKPCIGYYYDEEYCSPSAENFKTSSDQGYSKNIEIRILKRDVLIRVTCKNQIGFTEVEFASEMKKLDLSLTKPAFMPFGDNMLAVSAVAKTNEGFSLTEEQLAISMRLAILRLLQYATC